MTDDGDDGDGGRPDWVCCIKKGPGRAWCGRQLVFHFAFVDRDHALRAIAQEDYLVPCEACLEASTKAMVAPR
jgi:hypothetical protein